MVEPAHGNVERLHSIGFEETILEALECTKLHS